MNDAVLPFEKHRVAGFKARERDAERKRREHESAAEIGPCPEVEDPRRRAMCRTDLLLFLQYYFPHSTGLNPFSPDHMRIIQRIQYAVLHGGRVLNAVYRGFAKTTITENAAIWAVVYGHRRFVCIVGADKDNAKGCIDSIKAEFETNDRLAADFPELCYPVEKLEGKTQRCKSQTCEGELTNIEWTAEKIVLPTAGESAGGGAVITVRGITSSIRGMKHKGANGVQQRPDFVFLDDIQTDESARQPGQCETRLSIIHKSVLKLAGHKKTLAGVLNATVICKGDAVDRMLTEDQYASWQAERVPMVKKWADKHESFWLGEYADVRRDYNRELPGDQLRAWKAATELYESKREEADAGCDVSWPWCYDEENEISAIQHCYNFLIDDGEEVFASECQQQPIDPTDSLNLPTAQEIAERLNSVNRGVVPNDMPTLTAFIDVSDSVLWWMVCAFKADFTGAIVDYGTFPDQNRPYVTLASVKKTLRRKFPGAGKEGAIQKGLAALVNQLVGSEWKDEGGSVHRVNSCMIDEGHETNLVRTYCRRSPHASSLKPSRGRGIRASQQPLCAKRRAGDPRPGHYWKQTRNSDSTLSVHLDTNYWKSFIFNRLAVDTGDSGALSLFGRDAGVHRMVCDQLTVEKPEQLTNESTGVTTTEWKQPPHADNHFLDCLVGCYVAASMQGVSLPGTTAGKSVRKKVKLSDLYARKHGKGTR